MTYRTGRWPTSAPSNPSTASASEPSKRLQTRDARMAEPTKPPIKWTLARAATIRQSIAATERQLLHDLEPRERADVLARLEVLRRLVRAAV